MHPAPLLAIATLLAGCDLTAFAASSASGLVHRATPGIEGHWDYELVGDGLPGQLLQIDALLSVTPENETLLLDGARAYASFSFGWVEDHAEELALAGRSDAAAQERRRARWLYERATRLGHRHMELRYGGFDEARSGDLAGFVAWLDELDDPEDAESLWWVGYAWGLNVNASHPTESARDRAYAIAMVRRSVELDPSYYGSSGLALLAYVATRHPGADLDEAEGAWERALDASHRTNLLAVVTMARTYAVARRDRDLYVSLLREVVDAGDIGPDMRLSNKVARHRARRYLGEADRLFGRAVETAFASP